MTSEMAFIESLLLQKRHFLSNKRGRLFKKYFFSFCNWGTLAQKKGTFFTFKKVGGGHMPPLPPPVPRPLVHRHVRIVFSLEQPIAMFSFNHCVIIRLGN